MRSLLAAALLLVSAASASAVTVDGTVDAEYGTPLAVQGNPTQFGDNESELNAAYALLDGNGNLSLMLTGNLQANNNGLVIFIDSRAGGAVFEPVDDVFGRIGSVGGAKTDDWGTDTNGEEGVNVPPGGGSILDPDFNPDVSIEINAGGGGPAYYTNIIDLTLPNSPNPNRDVYLGVNDFGNPAAAQVYDRDDDLTTKGHGGLITHAFNNSNTAGVTNSDASTALTATTGYEALFSSEFLANDGSPIRIMAFVTSGEGGFLSNQFLGESGLGVDYNTQNLGGPGNPGGEPLFDARVFPGNQFFTVEESAPGLEGDYNEDGTVDAADYVLWRKLNINGAAGYTTWRTHYGESLQGAGGTAGVPEPSAAFLAIVACFAALGVTRRK